MFTWCSIPVRTVFWLVLCGPVWSLHIILAEAPLVQPKDGDPFFEEILVPFLEDYCFSCHAGEKPQASVALDTIQSTEQATQQRTFWKRVLRALRQEQMPPEDQPVPTVAERVKIVRWIEEDVLKIDCQNVGFKRSVTMRRLNRAEYNNTVRDLFGVDFRPGNDFPTDDVGYGFDNIGEVLFLSPLLMEKYLDAAEQVTEKVVTLPALPLTRSFSIDQLSGGNFVTPKARIMYSRDREVIAEHDFKESGIYIFRVAAYSEETEQQPSPLAFNIDGNPYETVDVQATVDLPGVYATQQVIVAGNHKIGLRFLHEHDKKNRKHRTLAVMGVEILGPLERDSNRETDSHRSVFICWHPGRLTHDSDCAREIMENLIARVYRRPVSGAEIQRMVELVNLVRKEGQTFERGIQVALQAAMTSPHFLFRVEPDLNSDGDPSERQMGDYELASRLSYFLWSSLPDDELFQLAATGRLRDADVLRSQVIRMIQDPKIRGLVENFAGQWLQLRNLDTITPDRSVFPEFDNALRRDMRHETELFFEAMLNENRSLTDFLDANFTFLNQRLASHYGLPFEGNTEWSRIALSDKRRGGLLTQASILTVTSNSTRTSPVKRGKWIMENILGTPPPPPPPDVPELNETRDEVKATTLRQRMQVHRENPSCASCHRQMDTLGFGFENYDGVGRWREREGPFPVDASGELPGGARFQGPEELKEILKAKMGFFSRCITEKMLTYALGRGLDDYDQCVVDRVVEELEQDDYRFSSLIIGIIQSDPFQNRRSVTGEPRDE